MRGAQIMDLDLATLCTEASKTVNEVNVLHRHVQIAFAALVPTAQRYYEACALLSKVVEAEFPGCQCYFSKEWPYDTARICSTLEKDPPEQVGIAAGSISVTGPDDTRLLLSEDRLIYDPLFWRPGEKGAPPAVSWKPRALVVRCSTLEELSKVSFNPATVEEQLVGTCPYCKAQLGGIASPRTTPRLNRYDDDRLVRCGQCARISVTFVTEVGLELRPAQ